MKTVGVILSSFNGKRFIRDQIDSILNQDGVSVDLYIRDDGSKDGTRGILKRYSERSNVFIVLGENQGVGNSFMELLYSLPDCYDYYAFSDQDDVWMEDKLQTAVDRLEGEQAVLYGSNLLCVDKDLNPIGMLYDTNKVFCDTLLPALIRTGLYGCTLVFTRDFFKMLCNRRPSRRLMKITLHDQWVPACAVAVGKIIYDQDAHIQYRRHGKNYTSIKNGFFQRLRERAQILCSLDRHHWRSFRAREMIRCYPEYVERDKDAERIYNLALPEGVKKRYRLIRDRRYYIVSTGEPEYWFALKALIGFI